MHRNMQFPFNVKQGAPQRPLREYTLTDARLGQPVSRDISEKTGFCGSEEIFSEMAASPGFGGKLAYWMARTSA
jgi:hypothetical protein